MNPRVRTFFVWLFLLCLLALLSVIAVMDPSAPTRDYESLIADVQSGAVLEVEVGGDDLIVHLRDGVAYTVSGFAEDQGILAWLDDSGIAVYEDRSSAPWLLPAVLGLAVLVGVVYALRRRQQAGTAAGKTIFDMRRSNARQLKPGLEQTRFADVGGHEEIKEALGDVVDFLKEPARWTNAGVRLPRGVLLEGPPGGGKTLLARAVAGEAGAPFFVISASEFVEMFVGVGAARIRDLFETARKVSPAVIFIDEIDAVGRRRGSGLGTAHDEREQTLNQLLVCLDGFEPSTRLVVIAATNRSDVLDRALLRPGRFDLRLTLGFPDVNARAQILKIHCRGKPLTPGLDLRLVAEATPGASGATLEHLCNEAGMRAVRRSRKADRSAAPAPATITVDDFLGALESASKIERKFDALDALLVESTSQFTQPSGEVHARLALADGSTIDGRIVWADASYVKIVPSAPAGVVARLIPKSQLRGVEALAGTSMADEIRPDAWAKSRTESA